MQGSRPPIAFWNAATLSPCTPVVCSRSGDLKRPRWARAAAWLAPADMIARARTVSLPSTTPLSICRWTRPAPGACRARRMLAAPTSAAALAYGSSLHALP